jgi:predicted DNA-binding transcriptional regulator AlpA
MTVENKSSAAQGTAAAVSMLVASASQFRTQHGLTEKQFYNRLRDGLLPERIDIGGHAFFRRADTDAWCDPIKPRRSFNQN